MEQKTCRVCKETKSVDMFGRLHGGYAYECKQCKSELGRAYREKHKESLKERKRAHYRENSDHIRAKSKAWYDANKAHAIARQLEYVNSRREWYSQYKKKWRELNKLRVVQLNAAYRAENREQVRAATNEWFKKFPQKRKEYFHARRAKLQSSGGRFTVAEIDELRILQRGRCACCGVSLKKSGEHIDHVVAIANGGTNDISNIQLLCPPCNQRKSAKDPLDFMQQNGFLL